MTQLFDIPYGNHPLMAYDSYSPEPLGKNAPVIIHFHGGGLSGGEKKSHPYVDALVALGYRFFDCNYRLIPEVTEEEILCDCALAVKTVMDRLASEAHTGKLFIAADSAGAWITMMLAFRPAFFEAQGVSPSDIAGYVFDDAMPIVDFNHHEHFTYITDLLDNPDCPLYYLKSGQDYPPMYFSTFGRSIPHFPEYVHMAVATLLRYGYGDRLHFGYYPALPHCGNFTEKDGIYPYVTETDRFYKSVLAK